MDEVKKPIHQRLIARVQAVTHGKPVPAENQGATKLKKPRKVFIPPPRAKGGITKKNILGK